MAGKWSCCNVGAATPFESGDYYAWGETEKKNNFSLNNYEWYSKGKFTDIGTNIQATEYDAAWENQPEGDNEWKMPSFLQATMLSGSCKVERKTINNTNHGWVFTSSSNGNKLFFPRSGYRDSSLNNSTEAMYFTSMLYTPAGATAEESDCAFVLKMAQGASPEVEVTWTDRYYGLCIRPVWK